MKYVYGVFNGDTGKCSHVETVPKEKPPSFTFGDTTYLRIEGDFVPSEVYLDLSTMTVKPVQDFPFAVAQENTRKVGEIFSLANVPNGTTVVVDEVEGMGEVTDGLLELEFATVGKYTVYLSHPAYKHVSFTVICDD